MEYWIIKIGSYIIVALAFWEAGWIKANLKRIKYITDRIEKKLK